MPLTDLRVLDSVTQLGGDADSVVVAASHGGAYAGYLAADAGARGVVLNDAGGGKGGAGYGALPVLDRVGLAAATVGHDTARIGDGVDSLRNGVITHVNDAAADLGCRVGDDAIDCATGLRDGTPPDSVPDHGTARYRLRDGDTPVWGMDSLSLIRPSDADCVVVTGSHGARLAGETESYVRTDVAGAVFNDAGGGKDGAGTSRLPMLADYGVPAATVAAASARIGDGRETWQGTLSAVNTPARDLGAAPGDDCPEFARLVAEAD
ncbi:hypothetical protein [Halobacterium litoreum]|uniref:Uncharacterized protein n=1 Tax=Halobacterium litoreum TaxID=2039234 RepID=A0ABD5NG68_9EURY|nr:hypothetical protein [Halobacterium litoreum]UHH12903.1 hypothetical protein LT972_12135 [Halobacterium litoreum]